MAASEQLPHLVELKLEAQDVAESLRLAHVGLNERQEELVLVGPALVHLQDDVQHAVGVQVEATWKDTR